MPADVLMGKNMVCPPNHSDTDSEICYVDKTGKEYSRVDLDAITKNEETTNKLLETIKNVSPENYMKNSFFFTQCKRCGTWLCQEKIFHRKSVTSVCPNCRPVKIMGTFPVINNPFDDDRNFYHKRKVTFRPGITTVFGCNGSGKSTLFRQLKDFSSSRGTPCYFFDNAGNDGGQSFSRNNLGKYFSGLGNDNNLSLGIQGWFSSEGENVVYSLSAFFSGVLQNITMAETYGEAYIIIDALDSGLSYDVISIVKKTLFDFYEKHKNKLDLYILLSSNSWEMSEGTNCFSLEKMKYMDIRSYSTFCKQILQSAKRKKSRDRVFAIKQEISQRPREVILNKDLKEYISKHRFGNAQLPKEETLFTVKIGNYGLSLILKNRRKSDDYSYFYQFFILSENGVDKVFPKFPLSPKDEDYLYTDVFDGMSLAYNWEPNVISFLTDTIFKLEMKNH